MTAKSPIAAALAQLQLERANLAVRLAKVDEAIATLGDLFHLPVVARHTKVTDASHRSSTRSSTNSSNGSGRARKSDTTKDAIREALKSGALSSVDLAGKVGLKRPAPPVQVREVKTP